jgi:hypothetical protein
LILPQKSGEAVKPLFCYSTIPFHNEPEIFNRLLNAFGRAPEDGGSGGYRG